MKRKLLAIIKFLSVMSILTLGIVSIVGTGGGGSSNGGGGGTSRIAGPWDWWGASFATLDWGNITFDNSGTVTDGTWNEIDDGLFSGTFTSGSFNVSAAGAISGNITADNTITFNVVDGQVNPTENLAVFAMNENVGDPLLAIISLLTGTTNFQTSDLEGLWASYTSNQFGLIQGDNNGNVTNGDWYLPITPLNILDGDITGGKLVINGEGSITGNVLSDFPLITTIQFARMDESKQIVVAKTLDSTGAYTHFILVKVNGAFVTTDLQGTWHFVTYFDSGDISYSTVNLDVNGNIISGTYSDGVNSGTYTGGTITISAQGSIGGIVATSDGDTLFIHDGQMSSNKDSGAMLTQSLITDDTAVSCFIKIN